MKVPTVALADVFTRAMWPARERLTGHHDNPENRNEILRLFKLELMRMADRGELAAFGVQVAEDVAIVEFSFAADAPPGVMRLLFDHIEETPLWAHMVDQ